MAAKIQNGCSQNKTVVYISITLVFQFPEIYHAQNYALVKDIVLEMICNKFRSLDQL